MMKERTRRAVAYVAGRLITGTEATSVYDCDSGTHYFFTGVVTPLRVSIYDTHAACGIDGKKSSGSYMLYHYGNKRHFSLEITGARFDGYDFDSMGHFSGSAGANLVTVFDYRELRRFSFLL